MFNRLANDEYYKKIGICRRCHSREAEPNRVLCFECSEADRLAYQRQDPEKKKAKQDRDTAMKRIIRAKRLESGLCPKCGKRPSLKDGLCLQCRGYLARYREKQRQKKGIVPRSELRGNGLCYICGGKRPAMPGKCVCEACYEDRLKAMEKCHEGHKRWLEEGDVWWRKDDKLIFAEREKKGKA